MRKIWQVFWIKAALNKTGKAIDVSLDYMWYNVDLIVLLFIPSTCPLPSPPFPYPLIFHPQFLRPM